MSAAMSQLVKLKTDSKLLAKPRMRASIPLSPKSYSSNGCHSPSASWTPKATSHGIRCGECWKERDLPLVSWRNNWPVNQTLPKYQKNPTW